MARKSFRTSAAVGTIEFEIDDEVFHCHKQLPVGILLQFADLVGGEDDDDEVDIAAGRQSITAVKDFFNAAIVKEDRERFFALLNDPDRVVDINLLLDIANWLGEQFTARPTGAPSASTSPETGNGDASTAGALPADTTFSRRETPVAG